MPVTLRRKAKLSYRIAFGTIRATLQKNDLGLVIVNESFDFFKGALKIFI
jgi:hypothetical protein